MASDSQPSWTRLRLGDCVDLVVGFPFESGRFTTDDADVRLLRGDNVGQGRLRWNGARRWPAGCRKEFARFELQPGDVVVAMDRPWIQAGLKYAVVREEDVPSLLVQRVARLRGTDVVDQRYLGYLIGSPAFTAYVKAIQTGTAVPHISGAQIEDFPVVLPPLQEQRRIASVLRSLDDKIDSNRHLANLLNRTASELFRARFVDFVGVHEFDDSAIGPLPRGWRAGNLKDVARFVNGKPFTKEANGRGRPILRIKELKAGVSDDTPLSDIDAGHESIARGGDILFAWSGSLDVYRWSGPASLINQHIFKVLPEGYPLWFVYWWIAEHMRDFQAIARDKATTMGHIQRRHLAEAGVPLPDRRTLASQDKVMGPIDQLMQSLARESRLLADIRDALLPRLASGQMRVPQASGGTPPEVADKKAAAS